MDDNGGEGRSIFGNAACRMAGWSMLVQKSLTRCAAAPRSAASMSTGAPRNDYTKSLAFCTAAVHLSPGYVFSSRYTSGVDCLCWKKLVMRTRS